MEIIISLDSFFNRYIRENFLSLHKDYVTIESYNNVMEFIKNKKNLYDLLKIKFLKGHLPICFIENFNEIRKIYNIENGYIDTNNENFKIKWIE